jgi:hypothetical protein
MFATFNYSVLTSQKVSSEDAQGGTKTRGSGVSKVCPEGGVRDSEEVKAVCPARDAAYMTGCTEKKRIWRKPKGSVTPAVLVGAFRPGKSTGLRRHFGFSSCRPIFSRQWK